MTLQTSETPCLCTLLRRASRTVSRVYDAELRACGLRVTQFSVLALLGRSGEVRQSDLGALTYLDETSVTRALKPLIEQGWIAIRPGDDRREKWVAITESGKQKIKEVRPAWSNAQKRMKETMPEGTWDLLFATLPGITQLACQG